MFRNVFILSVIPLLVLTACGSVPASTDTPMQNPTTTIGVSLSFDAAVYQNEDIGFELSYPAAWSLPDESALGDRADAVTFTTPEDKSFSLVIYRWEPTGDLAAYTTQRRLAWENSETAIVEEQNLILVSGLPAHSFMLNDQGGTEYIIVFIPFSDRYLEFSGTITNELIIEIASTVRPLTAP